MIFYLIFTGIIICFSFVLLRGAPYVPTLQRQTEAALDLLDLSRGQSLLELGCGDGTVLIAAAKRGIMVTGYELNPLLALLAWLRTRRYRGNITVVWGDFWQKKWPATDGIFTFLLPKYMSKLNKKIIQDCKTPVKLASFAFKIPEKKPAKEREGVWLYLY